MGFFDRLKSKKKASAEHGGGSDELELPVAGSSKEKRANTRYPLNLNELFRVDFGAGPVGIRDLSYGGFVAEVSGAPEGSANPQGLPVTIYNFEKSCKAKVGFVYSRGKSSAFRFHHETPDTLLFLRGPIESLRFGSSLTPIPGELLKAPYNQAGWVCLRGEGPTDLVIAYSTEKALTEALMTFRSGETYREISLKNGLIKTSRSIDTTGYSASRMAQTETIDLDSLKTAIMVLAGIQGKSIREYSDPLQQKLFNLLIAENKSAGTKAG